MMHKLYENDWHPTDEAPAHHRFSIVWEDMQTERLALRYARGAGQRFLLEGAFWNVDREPSKLRQRLEDAGFTFEPVERYADGSHIYRIYKPRMAS